MHPEGERPPADPPAGPPLPASHCLSGGEGGDRCRPNTTSHE